MSKTNAVALAPKKDLKVSYFLRLFILATSVTLLMSIWMVARGQTTTFYSGTFYPTCPVPAYSPAPSYYYYVPPQPGYNYPIGPSNGAPNGPTIPPYLTTLPSNGYFAPYSNYYDYSPPGYYSYPANGYPYPLWVPQNSIYYSGPAGGGGTIYSNSTVTSSNNGISYDHHGWNFNFGNTTSQSSNTTTVTTHR